MALPPIDAPILSQEWREEHVRRGDAALLRAVSTGPSSGHYLAETSAAAAAWAAIAQAHYAAANVRAKPQDAGVATRSEYPTAQELLDGPAPDPTSDTWR
jgi:hypothetical protein